VRNLSVSLLLLLLLLLCFMFLIMLVTGIVSDIQKEIEGCSILI
jgi:hypothetical protein